MGIIPGWKAWLFLVGLLLLGSCHTREATWPDTRPWGFTADTWSRQQALEEVLLKGVDRERLREHLRFLTDQPHLAGTPGSLRVSQYIFERFREYGLEAEIREYEVLLAYPETVEVEMVAPERVPLANPEPVLAEDPHSRLGPDPFFALPWNAYAADGDLEAPLLYAYHGRPEDLDLLEKLGLDLRGKILLVRYFEGYRGGKSLEAEKRGVAGLLIYCDPMEDGFFQGDVFPAGPWGPLGHFQRGANVYDFLVPGDPLTPGWPSRPGARRLKMEEVRVLPRIPTVPLSASDAQQLLARLKGPVVPKGWQGALPLTYHIGGGEVRVRIRHRQQRPIRTIRNVIGRLPGTAPEEGLIILSNHHDAWIYGAVDPASGTAAMLELARLLGELAGQGKNPRRTILFGSWDAEEYTLTGSTEWGEEFADQLKEKAIACLNVDTAVSGSRFTVGASPLLHRFIREATSAVTDPETGLNLLQKWTRQESPDQKRGYIEGGARDGGPSIGRLGSGSDYTVFFNHLGIPSLDMYFDGPYGVYHSVYDGFVWMERFGDPGFSYHGAMTQLWGVMATRLANADLLPFDPQAYARAFQEYVKEAEKEVDAEFYQALAPLLKEAALLEEAAQRFQGAAALWLQQPEGQEEKLRKANRNLRRLEQALTSPSGLPDRPWFKHLVYAPLPSYRPEIFPGIREGLRRQDLAQARTQASLLLEGIRELRRRLESIR